MDNGNALKTPINISDLMTNGTDFQFDTDFGDDNGGNEFFIDDDYGSADEDEEKYKQLLSPWERPFAELRAEMEPISEHVYKRVTKPGVGELLTDKTRVLIDYNAFFEGESKPFDSTMLRDKPFRFVLGEYNVLEGLEQSVRTMRVCEEAQFLISYQVLYGEVGCPPRIKPKADGLFVIRLISASEAYDGEALTKLDETERRTYAMVKEKVAETRQYAKDCFKRNLVPNAIVKYLEAVDTLQMCHMKDEEEEREQRETLVTLYTSLAVCYNRRDQPKDVCRMVNEIKRLGDISGNAKVLYQEGRALLKLGEYDRSRKSLLRAQQLEPQDENIQQALKALNECSAKHQKEERMIWSRAFGMVAQKKEEVSKEESAFVANVKDAMELFLEDENCSTLPLPDGLSEKEVTVLERLADELQLKLSVQVTNNKKHYKFQKSGTA